MPELVTCPVCGCRVQVADALLGRRIRCFGCNRPFIAVADRPSPPSFPPPRPSPTRGEGERLLSSLVGEGGGSEEEELLDDERRPFCPGCGRRISWDLVRCLFCGEELEPEDDAQRWRRRAAELVRREYEPHRGALIASLGNVSMIAGGLSLCMVGLGAIISVPVGVLAWLMANRDLEAMRQGRMDPRGKRQTETGRAGAIAGVILGLIFAVFYALVFLAG